MAAPSPQTTLKSRATEAARRILQDHLSLHAGETVTLFHDEQGVACANCFTDAARYLRIRALTRYVPADKQVTHNGALSREDAAALDQADAVLTCFAETQRSNLFRRQIIDHTAGDQRVLGSLSPNMHALAQAAEEQDPDWPQRCGDLAQIFLRGREAEVVTAVRDGRGDIVEEHRLTVALGGFPRAPVTSGGAILSGTWARLPSPEVTIAPVEDSANGVFVLNGAFPGAVMSGAEHLLLIFSAGRLEMVGGNSPRVGEFWKIVEAGKTPVGQPLGLSELGIRLWDLVTDQPRGCLLQLGLGDNTSLGGALRSPVQELLLNRLATLRIDGQPVLENGRYAYSPSAFHDSADSLSRLGAALSLDSELRLTAHTAQPDPLGRLRVIRHVGHKRVCTYSPGDDALSHQLCALYLTLTEQRSPITLQSLAQQLVPGPICGSLAELRGLLALLRQHRLIEAREALALEWNGEAA